MSWSSGNKKWTIPFKSLNGTDCRVDIYARGYTGSAVTTLVASANPFEYEENDEEDVLSTVVRYRTGYLRVIEENYGDLNELYPSINTDRYIEFYYGNVLDFNGFIQAQEFENPWTPGPREVELPIISPLGLASGTDIDWNSYNPPRWVSIESLIFSLLGALEGNYEGYYFPKIISINESLTLNAFVNSLTFCPWGNSYDKGNNTDGIYESKNIEYALSCVCTWMGCILHDVPGYVIFQRLDYDGQYMKRRDTSSPYFTPALTDLTAIATIASDQNTKSKVMPMSKIDIQYAGELDVPNMNFSRCRGYLRPCGIDGNSFCTNTPMIGDFEGTYTIYASVDTYGQISKGHICLGAYGSGGLQEMIMFRPADDWGTKKKLATYKFFEWNQMAGTLTFSFRFGHDYENLNNPESMPVAVIIKSGDYYWNSQQHLWLSISDIGSRYSYNWADGRETCEAGFSANPHLTSGQPLVVEFYAPDNSSDYVYAISNVGLKKYSSAGENYLNPEANSGGYTITGTPSLIDGFVERGYSTKIYTLNRICLNTAIINTGALENEITNAEPQYPYVLTAQDRLKLDMKMTRQDNSILYLNKLTVLGSSGNWKTIAYGFKPWDDTYTFTLHHSSVFDS